MVLRSWGRLVVLMVALALAGVAALAVGLRLTDPLSTSTLPAEDPYTHLGLTREHLRDGHLDDLDGQGDPYPPGLHAVLATVSVTGGVPLEDLVRFGPVAFGVVLVAGVALLVGRLEGAAAALVAALLVAVTPELVFRQQMMAPTALDLALLPFALLGLALLARGRLAWAAPTAVLLAFLVVAHPWSFGILGLTGLAFLLLAVIAPWSDRPGLDAGGLACAILLLGSASALALSGCWGACGPGFTVLDDGGSTDLDLDGLAIVVGAGSFLLAGAIASDRRLAQRGLDALRPLGRTASLVVGLGLASAATATILVARQRGYPNLVAPEFMLGWPLIVVGIAGLAVVPFARRPGAHVAAALIIATLPFTLLDPFHSPFWPHRTAAYLGIALACSAGCAAGWAARFLGGAAATWRGRNLPWARAIVPGFLVAVVLGAGLAAAAPPAYPPWYRLHDECEAEALRDLAAQADANPRLVIDTGSWQTRLVLAATADNASRIWYDDALLKSDRRQRDLVAYSEGTHRPVLIVVDRQSLAHAGPGAVLPHSPEWSLTGTWPCPTPVTAYAHTPK
jgi:hypothetical protein